MRDLYGVMQVRVKAKRGEKTLELALHGNGIVTSVTPAVNFNERLPGVTITGGFRQTLRSHLTFRLRHVLWRWRHWWQAGRLWSVQVISRGDKQKWMSVKALGTFSPCFY